MAMAPGGIRLNRGKEIQTISTRDHMSVSFVQAYDNKLGLRYMSHPKVYSPREDTYLLGELALEYGSGGRFLELGSGTGIVSAYISLKLDMEGVGVDVNPWAAYCTRMTADMNGAKVHAIIGSATGAISDRYMCDIVIFNPPYLPEDRHIKDDPFLDLATVGGPLGSETALEWVMGARRFIKPSGLMIFITSSLSHFPSEDEIEGATSLQLIERREISVGDYFEYLVGWVLRR